MKVLSVINNDKDAVTKEYVDSKAGVTAVDPTSGPVETDFFIPTKTSELTNDSGFITEAALTTKQDTLVSGTNIKTINNQSLLGSGNINISGGGGTATDVQINGTSITSNNVANIITETAYDASTNKIATMSDLDNKLEYINASFLRTAALQSTAITSEQRTMIDSNKYLFYFTIADSYQVPNTYRSLGWYKDDVGVTHIKFECGDTKGLLFTIYRNNTVALAEFELLKTSKIKTTTSTTAGDIYDVTYINTMLGDIETLLGGI